MNIYLIPTTPPNTYAPYDHLYLVVADSPSEAYMKAKFKLTNYVPIMLDCYEYYPYDFQELPPYPFHKSQKYDILNLLLDKTKGLGDMAYFNVDWNDYIEELSKLAQEENWSNSTYPNKRILTNYIAKTYNKLQAERKVVFGQNYALFNTGLFTKYYEPIYVFQSGSDISFLTGYELSNIGITERPERANYFESPGLLLFDWHYPIDVQYKHILDDERNRNRLPREFLESNNMINILNGAIDTMKKRVSSNYKLAIPQYFDGKIQLLLPLCLMSDTKPDVAIAVTKKEMCYQGHTCLTLDMAYNNARLIAKPESNWLIAESIIEEPNNEPRIYE